MKKFNIIKNIALLFVLISTILMACSPDQSKEYNPELITFPTHTFTSFSPATGYPGTPITITGTNFGDVKQAAKISFSEADVDIDTEIVSYSDTEMVVLVPKNAGDGPIDLSIWTNEAQSTSSFTYIPGVEISKLSANSGVIGDIISISGFNFGTDTSAITVFFDGVEATILNISNTKIEVEVPVSDSGLVTISYDNGNRETVGPSFVYLDPSIVYDTFLTNGSVIENNIAPINAIGDRVWVAHKLNANIGRPSVTDGYLTSGVGGVKYQISDNPAVGYTKPTRLTLEANFNLNNITNSGRIGRGFGIGFGTNINTGGIPISELYGVIFDRESRQLLLTNDNAWNSFGADVTIPFDAAFDVDADHHVVMTVNTSTGEMESLLIDGDTYTFPSSTAGIFTDVNTEYIILEAAGGDMIVYDVRYYEAE